MKYHQHHKNEARNNKNIRHQTNIKKKAPHICIQQRQLRNVVEVTRASTDKDDHLQTKLNFDTPNKENRIETSKEEYNKSQWIEEQQQMWKEIKELQQEMRQGLQEVNDRQSQHEKKVTERQANYEKQLTEVTKSMKKEMKVMNE
jgi:hypothetical protein